MTQNLPHSSSDFSTNGNGHSNGSSRNGNGQKAAGLLPPPPPSFLTSSTEQPAIQPHSPAGQTPAQPANQAGLPSTPAPSQTVAPISKIRSWRGSAVKMSLKTKATILALAIGTLPVIFVGGLAYKSASSALSQQITDAQKLATSEVLDKVAFYMRERYGDIQIMSNLNVFTDARLRATATPQEKQAALDQFVKAYPIYNSIAVFDLNGNVLAQSSGNPLDNHKNRNYFQTVLQTGQPVISRLVAF